MIIPSKTHIDDRFRLRKSEIRERDNNLPATEHTYRRMLKVLEKSGESHNVKRDISEKEARWIIKVYQIPKEKRFNNLIKTYANQRAKEKSSR